MSVSASASHENTVVPLRTTPTGEVAPVTHVRSTLLATSIMSLRGHGHLDAYLARLPADLHETVLHAVAGTWLPLDVGMAHYAAADVAVRAPSEQVEIGREVSSRIQNSVLGTLVRVAKSAGVTPWTGLEYFQRLWDRVILGGAGAVYRLGPKEARAEAHGIPLVRYAYFRNGWRGMILGAGQLFANKIYVTEISAMSTESSMAFRVAWA